MIPPEVMLTFMSVSILLALAPGPDNIFVMTQSALHGKKAGIAVTMGLCTGLIAHSTAVALGVAVIFQTSAWAFSVLKWLGAVYLVYLAWQAFLSSGGPIERKAQKNVNPWKLYGRGIIMNITNPKVSIFFLAFLPQFADSAEGRISLQILVLGSLFIVATILVFGSIALMAGTLGQWLSRSKRAQKIINRLAGLVFLGLALKLATAER